MSFAKAAAEVVYPETPDRDYEEERKERNREILKLALASGLLVGGAALGYAYREPIREALSSVNLIDTRHPLSGALQDKVGYTPFGVGATAGALSGTQRHLRLMPFLGGDAVRQQTLPGLARTALSGTPHGQEVARQLAGGDKDRAQAVARAITTAAGDRGADTVLGRVSAPNFTLDRDTPGARLEGVPWYAKPFASGRRGTMRALDRLSQIDATADAGRQALEGGTQFKDLPPAQRRALSLELQGVGEFGLKAGPRATHNPGQGGQRMEYLTARPEVRLGDIAQSTRQAIDTVPRFGVGRTLGRGLVGGTGASIATGLSRPLFDWMSGR